MSIFERIKHLVQGNPDRVKVGTRYVGAGEPVFFIAEIGINHNGDMDIAKKLIDVAVEGGADAVKFQKRTTTEILTREGLEKAYTSPHAYAPTYGAHRDKLEFNEEQYKELMAYAKEKNILFFASVWDKTSTDVMHGLGIDAYKIPSADITNTPLIEYVSQKGKPVLLSTGMSTFEEIHDAVEAVLKHNHRLILFHCLSLYPAPEEKLNMNVMDVLTERYKPLPVGYSGHEPDLLPTLVAVSKGACIVERHLTLDKTMKGSDHAGSLEPQELAQLVRDIRRIEKINGSREKVLYPELIPLREKLAKSVATTVVIPKGTVIEKEMLTIKGPGSGIKPRDLEKLVGRVAEVDLVDDALLPKEALEWKHR